MGYFYLDASLQFKSPIREKKKNTLEAELIQGSLRDGRKYD